jgi:Kef-type K+ transport system membrane component KefB
VSNHDLTSVLFILLLLVGLAQLLGYLFVRLRQPKVVGEILAGILLGPSLIGRFPFFSGLTVAIQHQGNILNFVYWLGLLLLMFLSGAETRHLFTREERREVGWLTIVGTGIPFILGLLLGPWLIRPALAGPNGNRISLIIILAVAVAVTSVPVVSKIFADLKILHTRFARLILGVAVLEDIVLWLALAVATAMAGQKRAQRAFHVVSPFRHRGLLRPRFDDCSAHGKANQQVTVQRNGNTLSGGLCNRGASGILRNRRSA